MLPAESVGIGIEYFTGPFPASTGSRAGTEFYLTGRKDQLNTNSLEAFCEASDFLKAYAECLDSAGIEFKSLHPENGPGQYELSLPKLDRSRLQTNFSWPRGLAGIARQG